MPATQVDLVALGASLAPVRLVSPQSPLSELLAGCGCTAVPAGTTIADAAAVMEREEASCVLVDDGAAVVTERVLARALAAGRALPSDPVEVVAVARADAPTVAASTSVLAAAGRMVDDHLGHVMVDLGGRATAVVAIDEVLGVLLNASDHRPWVPSLRALVGTTPETWLG